MAYPGQALTAEIIAAQSAILEEINNAPDIQEAVGLEMKLKGFRQAVALCTGLSEGLLIMAGDTYYLARGIERPMSGGVFLNPDYQTKE